MRRKACQDKANTSATTRDLMVLLAYTKDLCCWGVELTLLTDVLISTAVGPLGGPNRERALQDHCDPLGAANTLHQPHLALSLSRRHTASGRPRYQSFCGWYPRCPQACAQQERPPNGRVREAGPEQKEEDDAPGQNPCETPLGPLKRTCDPHSGGPKSGVRVAESIAPTWNGCRKETSRSNESCKHRRHNMRGQPARLRGCRWP